MFKTVQQATQFNQAISIFDFSSALQLSTTTDLKFSYIDNLSQSCFEALKDVTRQHFNYIPGYSTQLTDTQLQQLTTIFDNLLNKEPHYWFKKETIAKRHVYYFLDFFLQTENFDKVNYFTNTIQKLDHIDVEKDYITKHVTKEMSELIRNSCTEEKITASEIVIAINKFKDDDTETEEIVSYFNILIEQKKQRGLTYKHDDVVSVYETVLSNHSSPELFEKLTVLFSPEILKKHNSKSNVYNTFPHLTTRLDYIVARVFSLMNFHFLLNGSQRDPLNKNLTVPILKFLQKNNSKTNINDYVIGEFRYKFTALALEFVDSIENSEWTTQLNKNKQDVFDISQTQFSNFFVHLLCDTLVLKPKFNQNDPNVFQNPEKKTKLLLEYQENFPEQFKKDFYSFKKGLDELNLEYSKNANVNRIILYFKMMFEEENRLPVKSKIKKI